MRGAAAGLLPLALTAGLLGASPATAADDESHPSVGRRPVVEYWRTGGSGVKEAAERALLGGDEEIRAFIRDRPALQAVDDGVDVSRVINAGGPAVRSAAKAALASQNPDEVTAFLRDGWKAPLEQDRRVEASRVINFGGPGVQEAGKEALKGSAEDVAAFLGQGQYTARETDDRVRVSQLIGSGGPAMKAAGKVALQGSPDDIVEFLKVGQFTARNRDQEHATIAQLTEQAKQAGAQADDAAKTSQEASTSPPPARRGPRTTPAARPPPPTTRPRKPIGPPSTRARAPRRPRPLPRRHGRTW
ncbi:ALF repeat-containing protein [Streptomyces sp. NPDC046976]|uniref:ALF repeat-containing protein n=1 Tax=Streptomyces sp. NPDC046976 TaxID=3155258 RepID=UPI0033C13732